LYSGIEFYPLPEELRDSLLKNNSRMKKFKNMPLDEIALSCRFITKKASQSIVRQGFEYAKKHNKKIGYFSGKTKRITRNQWIDSKRSS